jgi:hypothetical protein
MKTIEQYIETELSDEMANKKETMSSLSVLAVGIGLWAMLRFVEMDSGMASSCTFLALLCTVAGIITTGMSISGAMSHYLYLPTRSRMREKMIYINNIDYSDVIAALTQGGTSEIHTTATMLWPVSNSSHAIRILASRDKACALIQAGRDSAGHFKPETDVCLLTGSRVEAIQSLLK